MELEEQRGGIDAERAAIAAELERAAALTQGEARTEIIAQVESELAPEIAARIRAASERVRDEADQRSREILIAAMQRHAADQSAETSVTVVQLPSDEMKGRIIGREGRNIRALEAATGVDLIIDDTPEAVVLRGFDPVRREVARMALEQAASPTAASTPPASRRSSPRPASEVEQRDQGGGRGRLPSRRASTGSTPSWSSCWAACSFRTSLRPERARSLASRWPPSPA